MKVIRKFQFTNEEVEALQTVRRMLLEVEDDDYVMLLHEIDCHSYPADFYEDICHLCKLAEKSTEENP